MLVPETILVALDGSSFAESALDHARVVARAVGSRLHLVTILDPGRSGATASRSTERRLQLIEAQGYLERWVGELEDDGLEASLETREGPPAHEVLAAAREREVDLVVVATRPRRQGERLLSRGVAQSIIASAKVSLLVARGGTSADRRNRRTASYRRIAVGVDGSPASRRALRLAASLARREGATLLLVEVLAAGSGASAAQDRERGPGQGDGAERCDLARWPEGGHLEALGRRLAGSGVEVETLLRCSTRVAETVEEAAREVGADLLVLGARGAGRAASGYGRCARHLLLHSEVPLLVVPEEERRTTLRAPRSTLRDRRRGSHIRRGLRDRSPVNAGASHGIHEERSWR